MTTNHVLLEHAIEITKEYARGGGTNPEIVLRDVYAMLKELNKDTSER